MSNDMERRVNGVPSSQTSVLAGGNIGYVSLSQGSIVLGPTSNDLNNGKS